MSALATWKEVQEMLDHCATGWSFQLKTHFRIIRAHGRTFTAFPKHGEIEVGHIKKMVRHLGILDCAKERIPALAH